MQMNAPSTASGGPTPPLRRGGSKVAAGCSVDPPPFTGEGHHAKPGGGGVTGRPSVYRHGLQTLIAYLLFLALPASTLAAQKQDADWPCIQRKVPELSLGQIWNGPELPASAAGWSQDGDIDTLVRELAARRVPVAEAEQEIRDFAAALPKDKAQEQLAKLFQGLFDHMNGERAQVMSGIGRYARNQIQLAERLRKEGSEVDAMRAKADADPGEIARRTDRLVFETRIFDERVQSLTYVCEVPTLIEQRLYALAKVVAEEMKKGQ
ncbi:hypothetical protein ACSBOB_25280 [Mesorhizobium sp. ASY16-5R]|uniref:hypothetical protein n=1 Tax=Mesorhizobium sp. ASY16-5R TaxID=3445772 RepID=UPI003FA130A2